MIVVADSSPLVILSKLGCFDLFNKLYPRLYISVEVHDEVVIAGAGLPGASQVANSEWIEVRSLQNHAGLFAAQEKFGLGLGELSTILLGKEIHADAVLLDDFRARKLAKEEGLAVRGSVGLLEALHRRGYLADLRAAFHQLLINAACLHRPTVARPPFAVFRHPASLIVFRAARSPAGAVGLLLWVARPGRTVPSSQNSYLSANCMTRGWVSRPV